MKEKDCDVPQGSVAGPGLYSDYSTPVTDIFKKHYIGYHQYADDTQIYLSFKPGTSEAEAKVLLERCLSEVRQWFALNSLKLNDQKTEFIIIGKTKSLKKVTTDSITIGKSLVTPTECVKNIGAVFDQNMSLEVQVNKTCKSAWIKLYQICKIKKFLTTDQLKAAIHAYVIAVIDQNNSLLKGLPKSLLLKLTRVQHAAARAIVGIRKHDHITHHMKELHWLPVSYRIDFKILLLVFKALHDEGPIYIKELLIPYVPARSLRSQTAQNLVVPRINSVAGERSFGFSAPSLWNCLPSSVKNSDSVYTFKKSLKTHFFRMAYS